MNANNYAIWRKCDLQIHTPRDPGWKVNRAGSGVRAGVPTDVATKLKALERENR